MEASGTGNMKLALNGAVTIGTLDGANIEIRDRVGAENFFLFGLDAAQAAELQHGNYQPRGYYERDAELHGAIDAIATGAFSRGDTGAFAGLLATLLGRDDYLTLADYRSYVDTQDLVNKAWLDPDEWSRMSVLNTARSGFFSADRTVTEYCQRIWHTDPVSVP
jgi:glycogen phosphorylase